jgi:HNH endonuclease
MTPCTIKRCKRRPSVGNLCKTHAKQAADRLFSTFIRTRDGACQECHSTEGLQCAHLISRRYLATRWNDDNAVALCFRCHKRYTERPLEWDDWCASHLGEGLWSGLKEIAMNGGRPDIAEVVRRLRGEET